MRTPTQTHRFKKLIKFLDNLDPNQFDFSLEVAQFDEEKKCGTVCCAIGWTPKVFPKLVRWDNIRNKFRLGTTERAGYQDVALELFGVPRYHDIFYPYDSKEVDERLPVCGCEATPQAVAEMLRKYMELYP